MKPNEISFTKAMLIELSKLPNVRVWRQNCGSVPVHRPMSRAPARYFDAGPPTGAADISGLISPVGWRLEVELKMPGEERSDEQLRWAAFCERSGAVYALVEYDGTVSLDANAMRGARSVEESIVARRHRS
jgi:hypothetical protein